LPLDKLLRDQLTSSLRQQHLASESVRSHRTSPLGDQVAILSISGFRSRLKPLNL
jgi:hypothetical protein